MKLKDLKNSFKENLKEMYSESEIDHIFFAIAENVLGKEKKILRLALNENWSDFEEKKYLFYHHLNELEKGKPLQYVLQETYFYGNKFFVNNSVLIPRPETEELVEWILADNKETSLNKRLLDVGTGSGCLAITINKEKSKWKISGIDISKDALKVAGENNFSFQTNVNFYIFNILDNNLNELENYDIIISNPPYIKKDEINLMDLTTKIFEPHIALFVENDRPLLFYEKLIELAQLKLNKNGAIYVEINQYLALETETLFKKNFKTVEIRKDISGNYRMIKASNL